MGNERILGVAKNPVRLAEAESAYRKAIELNPNIAVAYNNLGLFLACDPVRQNEAEMAYRTAIRLDPNLTIAFNNLGNLLKRDSARIDQAEAAYRKAIELDPTSARAHYNLGNLLRFYPERLIEAESVYRQAIDLDPNLAEAHCNLGLLLIRSIDRLEEALELLRRGHELGSARSDWRYPSKIWVMGAESLAKDKQTIRAIVQGNLELPTGKSALRLAEFARVRMSQPLAAARLFKPNLADSAIDPKIKAPYFYNAACAALRCAAGLQDASELDETQRASWRVQSLEWLALDLDRLKRSITAAADGSDTKPQVSLEQLAGIRQKLQDWLGDPDLAPLSVPQLDQLPEADRQPWRALWEKHKSLLESVESTMENRNSGHDTGNGER